MREDGCIVVGNVSSEHSIRADQRLGMAVRLSADLGLHLDVTQHVRSGRLTQRDADVRRTTFWGVFIHDK